MFLKTQKNTDTLDDIDRYSIQIIISFLHAFTAPFLIHIVVKQRSLNILPRLMNNNIDLKLSFFYLQLNFQVPLDTEIEELCKILQHRSTFRGRCKFLIRRVSIY